MGRTTNLKKSIYETLRNDTNTVYDYTRVPKKPSFPYITYQFSNSIESLKDKDDAVDILFEIDFFDYRLDKDTSTLDDLFDEVDSYINRKDVFVEIGSVFYRVLVPTNYDHFITSDGNTFKTKDQSDVDYFCYRLIRQNKLWQLPTIDEHTFRRQLVYTLKYERRD